MVYPPENKSLQHAIGERGLLVSERAPGFSPRAKDFPRRNRLISGISMGVVVIEAAERSGSLITARLAGEQGREVFAVPGSPLDPRAAGTNNLLNQGATLVTSAKDIVETLAPILGRGPTPPGIELASCDETETPAPLPDIGQSDRERVLEALGPSPVDIDERGDSLSCPSSPFPPIGGCVPAPAIRFRLASHPRVPTFAFTNRAVRCRLPLLRCGWNYHLMVEFSYYIPV